MPRRVLIAPDAWNDMLALYRYVAAHESVARAERVLTTLEMACHSLDQQPMRGNIPAEMQHLGVQDYREIHVGVYRIVYQVNDAEVVVYGVADGRRDMQGFLHRRLVR